MRVRIQTAWSNFDGREGVIVGLEPEFALVLLDGETRPLRFDRLTFVLVLP